MACAVLVMVGLHVNYPDSIVGLISLLIGSGLIVFISTQVE